MTQYYITLNGETVRKLFLGDDTGNVMKEIMGSLLNQLLEAKATDMCGAMPFEQTEGRKGYRNGHRERSLMTRFGRIELAVPRLRGQSTLAEGIIGKYKRSEQALMAGIAEMVVNGVSTRKVDEVAKALFGESVSKSQVSRVCKMLDPIVEKFMGRPLCKWYPFMIVDAMYVKVRESGRVVSKALYVAIGVNESGTREVLGVSVMDRESKESYAEFFRGLKARGLSRVDFGVSDSHSGLVEAFKEEFLGASWQRCQTHFSRNMLDKTPKKLWGEVKERLTEIYTARDISKARELKGELHDYLEKLAPKAAELLDDAFDDITAVFALPLKYRKKMRTSNMIERLNEELRRRERPIRVFPGEASVMRIIGSVCMEIHEKWAGSNRVFDMAEYAEHVKAAAEGSGDEPLVAA